MPPISVELSARKWSQQALLCTDLVNPSQGQDSDWKWHKMLEVNGVYRHRRYEKNWLKSAMLKVLLWKTAGWRNKLTIKKENKTKGLFVVVCWLLNTPATCLCISGVSAQTILSATTLRQKLQNQLSISPGHSILTLGQPVPALTL